MRNRNYLDIRRFKIPATGDGSVIVVRSGDEPVEAVIVSLFQGELGVWFGEHSGQPSRVPDWTFFAIGHPETIPVPRGYYNLTLASIGPITTDAEGSLILIAMEGRK